VVHPKLSALSDDSFAEMEDAMAMRPPAVPFDAISQQVLSHYGALVKQFAFVKMLPSERDVNYLLSTDWQAIGASDADFTKRTILKVSNGSDNRDVLRAQTETLLYCRKAGCRVQTVYEPAYLELELNGRLYLARLFSYIEGDLISSLDRESDAELFLAAWRAAGECVGEVSSCLRRYMRDLAQADGARHAFLSTLESSWEWNLCNVTKTISEYARHFPSDEPLYAMRHEAVQRRLAAFVSKHAGGTDLPRALVHNDPNDNNIVVHRTEHGAVVYLLDWGDLSYSYAVADAAIGAAYISDDEARVLYVVSWLQVQQAALSEVVGTAMTDVCDVEQRARALVEDLIVMRQITSVTLSNFQEQRLRRQGIDRDQSPEFQYLLISQTQMWKMLGP
jgi:Ser/Thr protein kinase RdoA (MazF antagonist)